MTMFVNTGSNSQQESTTRVAPIQYATASQKEEIIRLLNNPLITRQEKTHMLLAINRLGEERADQAINKLRQAIENRGNGTEKKPEYVPELASARVFSFYQLQQCAGLEVDMRKRVYKGRVENRKMTQEKADLETEMMARISHILRGLSTGELKLVSEGGGQVVESLPPNTLNR
jgi:hypothetical protein